MFVRYSIAAPPSQLTSRFLVDVPQAYQPRYNAAPSQLLPVATHENPEGLSFFYWGVTPAWAKNRSVSERVINIRQESLVIKPVLRKLLMAHRCIVPADGFYGWKRAGKKLTIPYRFELVPRDIFAFAALWEEYEDESGEMTHTFSVLTIPSNELVVGVQERMPVILERPNEKIWLDPQSEESELLDLLQPYPAQRMHSFTVSPRINSVSNDDAGLMLMTPPADQFGNLTLFD